MSWCGQNTFYGSKFCHNFRCLTKQKYKHLSDLNVIEVSNQMHRYTTKPIVTFIIAQNTLCHVQTTHFVIWWTILNIDLNISCNKQIESSWIGFRNLSEERSPEPKSNKTSESTGAFINSVVDTVIKRGMNSNTVSEILKNVDSEWISLKEVMTRKWHMAQLRNNKHIHVS